MVSSSQIIPLDSRRIHVSTTPSRSSPMQSGTVLWSEFVTRLLDIRSGSQTSAQFNQLSKDERLDAKDVGGYVLGSFSRDQSRKKSDLISRSGVALDCDHIDGADRLTAVIEAVKALEVECVVTSTRSHTPRKPRIRIVIPLLEPVTDGDQYQALARLIASKIDIDVFDKTTFESARLMFWGSHHSDVEPVVEHFKGPWLDALKTLKEYGEGEAWRDCAAWPRTSGEDPQGLRQGIEKAGDPLEKPGLVGLFNRTYDIETAIEEFLSDKYIPGAAPGRYTYSEGTSSNGAVVYDDSLFLYSHHESDPCYQRSVNAWDLVRLHRFGHLDKDSSASTPVSSLPSSVAMRDWARGLDAIVSSAADDFAAVAERGEPGALSAERWVYLSLNDSFYDTLTGVEYSPVALNRAFGRITPDVMTSRSGRVLNNPKEVSTSDYLMHYVHCPVVVETMYYPQAGPGVFEVDGVRYFNSFLERNTPGVDPHWERSGVKEIMEEYLSGLLLEDDANALLKFMAHNIQHPGKKIAWCPLVKGVPGDGKTTLAMILAAAMGRPNVKIISAEEINSNFNEWAHGACLGVLEEIRVVGKNRHDTMNRLKPLITNDIVSIIGKGKKGFNALNTQNYMAFTNYEDALAIDEDDRRWLPMFTRFDSRESVLSAGRNAQYFASIYDVINRSIEAVRGWLLSIDLTDFNPHEAPAQTRAREVMIVNSRSSAANSILNVIELRCSGVSECGQVISSQHINDEIMLNENNRLAPRSMSQGMLELRYVKVQPGNQAASSTVLGRRTRIFAASQWVKQRIAEGLDDDCIFNEAKELLEKTTTNELLL